MTTDQPIQERYAALQRQHDRRAAERDQLNALVEKIRDHVGDHGDGEIDVWSLRELLSHKPDQDHTNCTPDLCAVVTAASPVPSQRAQEPDEAAIRVDERADIARQLELLAADEALIADWVTTCDPIPLTVPGWLRALAGKIRAGDPDPGPALDSSSPKLAQGGMVNLGPTRRLSPAAGDRVEDGGMMGTLVRCEMCGGSGLLHQPDELPETVAPKVDEPTDDEIAEEIDRAEEAAEAHAHAQGYAEAVARLRDDERYTNWWMSGTAKPDGRIRQHLADYLETVGPDGVDVETGRWPAREQAVIRAAIAVVKAWAANCGLGDLVVAEAALTEAVDALPHAGETEPTREDIRQASAALDEQLARTDQAQARVDEVLARSWRAPETDADLLLESAWGVIANVGNPLGDWDSMPQEWREAAVEWARGYHAWLDERRVAGESQASEPARTRLTQGGITRRNIGQFASAIDALTDAYWKIRDHAREYRNTEAYRRHEEAWRADRDDPVAVRHAVRDRWYANGIDAAAGNVAELIGVPEAEIERPAPKLAQGVNLGPTRRLSPETRARLGITEPAAPKLAQGGIIRSNTGLVIAGEPDGCIVPQEADRG